MGSIGGGGGGGGQGSIGGSRKRRTPVQQVQQGGGQQSIGGGGGGGGGFQQPTYSQPQQPTAGEQAQGFEKSRQHQESGEGSYWQQHWEGQPSGGWTQGMGANAWVPMEKLGYDMDKMKPLYDQYGIYGWEMI